MLSGKSPDMTILIEKEYFLWLLLKTRYDRWFQKITINSVANVYSLLKDSFKDILQEPLEAELDAALGYHKNQKGDVQTYNKRNGHSTKNLKSQYGECSIHVPRDRNEEFEPKLLPKYQRGISRIEEKVISLYACGMSTKDIHNLLNDLYGIGSICRNGQ